VKELDGETDDDSDKMLIPQGAQHSWRHWKSTGILPPENLLEICGFL